MLTVTCTVATRSAATVMPFSGHPVQLGTQMAMMECSWAEGNKNACMGGEVEFSRLCNGHVPCQNLRPWQMPRLRLCWCQACPENVAWGFVFHVSISVASFQPIMQAFSNSLEMLLESASAFAPPAFVLPLVQMKGYWLEFSESGVLMWRLFMIAAVSALMSPNCLRLPCNVICHVIVSLLSVRYRTPNSN